MIEVSGNKQHGYLAEFTLEFEYDSYSSIDAYGPTEHQAIINLAKEFEKLINSALEERYMDKYYGP